MCSSVVLLGFAHTVRKRPTTAEILVPASLAIALAWPFPPTRYVLPLLPRVRRPVARRQLQNRKRAEKRRDPDVILSPHLRIPRVHRSASCDTP